jgi:ATPase subunit of ABC transporter with duplicated ATPase domains
MYLVNANDIQLAAGRRILLSHVSFTIGENEKIGIVGKNGTGKSTLLKLMAQKTPPKKGEVDVQASTWYVAQEVILPPEDWNIPVITYAMSKHDEGWNIFHQIEELFGYKLITPEKLMGQLSGGELTMVHLALGLMIEPQLLLLDEPTNHLDSFGTERLLKRLKAYKRAYVIVSHDSNFINETAEKIYEIREQKLNKFTGNYEAFMMQKAHDVAVVERKVRDYTKEIIASKKWKQKVSERILRRESEQKKLRFSGIPKIIQGYFADRAGKSTSHDMALAKQDERENVSKIKEYNKQLKKSQTLNIELGSGVTSVFSLVDLHIASLALVPPIYVGEKVLDTKITFRMTNEDKVLIKGRNGTGKSSLMKAIHKVPGYCFIGKTKPILPQQSLYIDQHYSLINDAKTLVTHVAEVAGDVEYEDLRKILGNYLFTEDNQVNQLAGTLSGGEKARLVLAMASVSPRSLLLLDEPTNNLDTESVEELIFALNQYKGGVMIVSHDVGFISKLNLTQQIELTGV